MRKLYCMMKRSRTLFLIILLGIGIFGVHQEIIAAQSITTLAESSGIPLCIEANAGEYWVQSFKIGSFKGSVTPQMALWMEDLDGNHLDTLYVTAKFAKQQWGNQPKQQDDEPFRIASVPYWMHKREQVGETAPSKKYPLADAVTAASPTEDFILHTIARTTLEEVYVLLEINNSFDENATYPSNTDEASAMYNGQPAVVYRARVSLNQPGEYTMSLLGHSDWAGQSGELSDDVSTLDTALGLVEQAVVIVE